MHSKIRHKVLLGFQFGVPQGSVLGPLLFNIDMINLFNECKDYNVASYADDTTLYSCALEVQTSALNFSVGLKKTNEQNQKTGYFFFIIIFLSFYKKVNNYGLLSFYELKVSPFVCFV